MTPLLLYAQTGNTVEGAGTVVDSVSQRDSVMPPTNATRDASTNNDTGRSLSNYEESIPETKAGAPKTVESELVIQDTAKPAIFPIDPIRSRLKSFY